MPLDELDEVGIGRVMLEMPFEKFERRRFLAYDKRDLAYIRFDTRLWRQLGSGDLQSIRDTCQQRIDRYYDRLRAD